MTPATLLIIATLLPLAAFVALIFAGKRLGDPLAGWLGTVAIGASFVCSLLALILWVSAPVGSAELIPIRWLPVSMLANSNTAGSLDLAIYIDSLTIIMFVMVTLVSTCVFVFSLGYMANDPRFPRFYTYLSLFCFSMLGLVIGGTLLHLLVFWELVGLCSYLLIGFWYERKSAANAATKAFVVNRVGDVGVLIGLGILFYHLGNVSFPQVWSSLSMTKLTASGIQIAGGWFTPALLTTMGIGLFCGAIGKSAQFPLHVWLPDAMEGPTPVSALIHAATMVAAGVYLVARIFPILTPDARLFIAIIGCITLTMAALIAVVQSDIKKVLAFSTLSQLGYMILAMGVGSWVGGLFHLITHAFFKALLFLGAGSVIHAAHHVQDLPRYGGLLKRVPFTALVFAVAVLAIGGTPLFSGFYSKEMIVAHTAAFSVWALHNGRSGWYRLFFFLPVIVAYITPFYMARCWTLTFWGRPRDARLAQRAMERPVMYVPLIVLAVFTVCAGYHHVVEDLLNRSAAEATALVKRTDAAFNGFATMWPSRPPGEETAREQSTGSKYAFQEKLADTPLKAHQRGMALGQAYVSMGFVVGIVFGFLMYMRGYAAANVLMKIPPLRWIHTWLYHRMYFDELYNSVFVGLVMFFAYLSGWFDKYVVDGVVNLVGWTVRQSSSMVGLNDKYVIDGAVNGVGTLAQDLGAAVRAPQTGRIRMYVTVLFGAIAAIVTGAIIVILSK